MTLKSAMIYIKLAATFGKASAECGNKSEGKNSISTQKNKNMSRKCMRAEKTEKYKQGHFNFVCKSDNFALIF